MHNGRQHGREEFLHGSRTADQELQLAGLQGLDALASGHYRVPTVPRVRQRIFGGHQERMPEVWRPGDL